MFWTLVQKELKTIIQSPKFILSFVTFTVLILLSFYFGVTEYRAYEKDYNTAVNLMDARNRDNDSWVKVIYMAYRAPNPMQIFASGVNNDIGRFSPVNQYNAIKLQHSVFTDSPIFAVFRYIDFTFIVTVILSLFAILFTFDSINGEKEQGTLKLIFSNSIPRSQYIRAKFTGIFLGMVVPMLIPILLGLLMLVLFNIPFTFVDWMKILLMLGVSVLYFTFFVALGILISAMTKSSSSSFLISLVFWISIVFIIPRVGIMTAGQFVKAPSNAEIESQKTAMQMQSYKSLTDSIQIAYQKFNAQTQGMTDDQKKIKQADIQKEINQIQQNWANNISAQAERLYETAQNKKDQVSTLGLTLSRISPASAYQLASMTISGDDVDLKKRTESQMKAYKQKFTEFIQKKMAESGGNMAYYQSLMAGDTRKSTIDFAELPRFASIAPSFGEVFIGSIFDIAILIILTLGIFAGAYFSFLKYDLR